jgi:hypothetical protein
METAIIIISTDAHFIKYAINRMIDDSLSNIIERVLCPKDFEVLIDELINENFRSYTIILDENTPFYEKVEIQNILSKNENQIHYNFIYGLELVDDFYESR